MRCILTSEPSPDAFMQLEVACLKGTRFSLRALSIDTPYRKISCTLDSKLPRKSIWTYLLGNRKKK